MQSYALRLKNGDDLKKSINNFVIAENISAGFIASSVGCVKNATIRNACATTIKTFDEKLEIISLNGTLSKNGCHLHISLSNADFQLIGGHLCEGTIVDTTCELIIVKLDNYEFNRVLDDETGYNELTIKNLL